MYDDVALDKDLAVLEAQGAKVFTIGYTLLGRPIKCVVKGNLNGPCAFNTDFWKDFEKYQILFVIFTIAVYHKSTINLLRQNYSQLRSVPDKKLQDFLLDVNGGNTDFSLWKANARAVDLNVNYNAKWGEGRQNVTYPAPSDYIGEFPVSEPENIALRDFINVNCKKN